MDCSADCILVGLVVLSCLALEIKVFSVQAFSSEAAFSCSLVSAARVRWLSKLQQALIDFVVLLSSLKSRRSKR